MGLDPIATLELDRWMGPFDAATREAAQDALESGKVLYFPKLPFTVGNSENGLLTDALSNGRAKNISRDPDGRIQGDAAAPEDSAQLSAMMGRFAQSARALVSLFPGYAAASSRRARPTARSRSKARTYSSRNDDKRLHVDAFPSRPQRGRRILRVFSNIHPMAGSGLACRRAVRGCGEEICAPRAQALASGALAVRASRRHQGAAQRLRLSDARPA